MSTAQDVRDTLDRAPEGTFIAPATIEGSRRAVECEFSRLTSAGKLIRVRKGLYWKGPQTPIGMPLPRPIEVALAVAGPGSGPAAFSAATHLGLTTQIPATDTIAVPGRTPSPVPGVRFVSRSIERRFRDLTPTEVAVIEVLRDGAEFIEAQWDTFISTVSGLVDRQLLRPDVIQTQLADEHHIASKQRWKELDLEPAS